MTQPLTRTTLILTAIAMLAFAGNSIINRFALDTGAIDPIRFTTIRIVSGAIVLALLILYRNKSPSEGILHFIAQQGTWKGAASLYIYAAAFSIAYLWLDAGLGALLLFASVQFTMIGVSVYRGIRMNSLEIIGALVAGGAFIYLVSPGISSPPIGASSLMIFAGIAWGTYSLLGASSQDAIATTTGNFARAIPMALLPLPFVSIEAPIHWEGILLAALAGAFTSGLGYALWYQVIPNLGPVRASLVQLTVPALAALMGAFLLLEFPGARMMIAAPLILGGVGLALYARPRR